MRTTTTTTRRQRHDDDYDDDEDDDDDDMTTTTTMMTTMMTMTTTTRRRRHDDDDTTTITLVAFIFYLLSVFIAYLIVRHVVLYAVSQKNVPSLTGYRLNIYPPIFTDSEIGCRYNFLKYLSFTLFIML